MDVLKDILDNLSDAVTLVDAHGRIVLFNTEAERIHKAICTTPLSTGLSFLDIQAPECRKDIEEILETVGRQLKAVKNFGEHRTEEGKSVYVELNFVPIVGPDQNLRFINIVARDITDRQIFERKLRAATSDMQKVLDQAYAVVIHIDSRGYVVEWNEHVAGVTGWSKQDILSRRLPEVLLDEGDEGKFDVLMNEIFANHTIGQFELPVRTRAGGQATLALSATPRVNANGKVIGATLVGQDITELLAGRRLLAELKGKRLTRKAEEPIRKEQITDLKSHFISIASHEFRSPLSSIDYATNFIKQNAGKIGRKKLSEKVAVIEKHVNYMSHLLEDVLNYSSGEHERIKVITEEVCVQTFITEAAEEAAAACRHSHEVLVCAKNPGTIRTDRKLLRNILSNLLANAIKFSPGHKQINLNVWRDEEAITFEVADRGIGIPADERDAIFEPFFRGKAVNDIQGTGLGLSIVKRATGLLNGNLVVDSVEGAGTVFRVTIPHGETGSV